MTREFLREEVEKEAAHRVKEVRHLAMVVPAMADEFARRLLMLACVVLFHAHLEGFVKSASRQFLELLEGEKIVPLRLGGEWGNWLKNRGFNAGDLLAVVHFLGMDGAPFSPKKNFLDNMKDWRNKIVHGGGVHGGAAGEIAAMIDEKRVQEMANVISDVIESFKDQILESIDKN